MMQGTRRMGWLVVAALLGACSIEETDPADQAGGAPDTAAASDDAASSTADIEALLDTLVVAWNRDDLSGHVGGYADAGTYTTPRGVVTGHAAITEQMRGFVQPDSTLAGTLAFDDVVVRMLGADHALATGAFLVEDYRDTLDINGRFTLVLAREPAGWRVIHDHSS